MIEQLKEESMNKKYIVRLSKKERQELTETVRSLKGSSQKARRAQILLKADVNGPAEAVNFFRF
jgi:translation initiation factor IF-2